MAGAVVVFCFAAVFVLFGAATGAGVVAVNHCSGFADGFCNYQHFKMLVAIKRMAYAVGAGAATFETNVPRGNAGHLVHTAV